MGAQFFNRSLFVVTALFVGASSAVAAPMTLYFTGTFANVSSENASGQLGAVANGDTFFGTATFDPATHLDYGDGVSVENRNGAGYLYFSLTDLNTNSTATNVGWSEAFGQTDIRRDYMAGQWGGDYNGYSFTGHGRNASNWRTENVHLEFRASDHNGQNSTLFIDPAGGLALDQSLNLVNEALSFRFWEESIVSPANVYSYRNTLDLNLTYLGTANPNQHQVPSPIPEPETYAMMLSGLGLLGVLARRRKQQG
jgi:hypothetical protein